MVKFMGESGVRARTGVVSIAIVLVLGAPLWSGPASARGGASAGGVAAAGFRSGAFYRALLLRHPPPFWVGGTLFVPRRPLVQPAPRVARPAPAKPPQPQWRRVPAAYLAAARSARHPGPLWVKTAQGFRLDTEGSRP